MSTDNDTDNGTGRTGAIARMLVLGSGAIGLTIAAQLALGGANVTVTARSTAATTVPLTLRRLTKSAGAVVQRTSVASVPGLDSAAATRWDLVVVAIGLDTICRADLAGIAALDSPVVAFLDQGPTDRERLTRAGIPTAKLLALSPRFLAFQGTRDRAREHEFGREVSYWNPPGLTSEVAGSQSEVFTRRLSRRGPRWSEATGLGRGPVHAAATMPLLAAWQVADWNLRRLSPALASGAAREAVAAVSATSGSATVAAQGTVGMALTAAAIRFGSPFDFDAYARHHFGKYTAQTTALLAEWIRAAEQAGLPHLALDELASQFAAALSAGHPNDDSPPAVAR